MNIKSYYHSLTRKSVIIFGRIFDDIEIIRKASDTEEETGRFVVPIIYSPKERMITRILSDPDLQRQVQSILPRMGFEITSINYDASRKQNSLLRAARANTTTHVTASYMGVPYDIKFQLNIYARNIDDGNYIVEQILPFFGPDFTVTTDMVPDVDIIKDIPIILDSVDNNIQYEGDSDSIRLVNWTLEFTMKMWFYGPIIYPKIIRTVYANIYNDPSLKTGYITRINGSNVEGTFRLYDSVYQGETYETANATGIVLNFDSNKSKLMLGSVQGGFKVGQMVHAVSTGGVMTISGFDEGPLLLAGIRITPDPYDAQPTDDYGYTVNIVEFPQTSNDYPILVGPNGGAFTADINTYTIDTVKITSDS
jgi:hypothetical protein